jgi:hypothetical protein
MLPFVFTLDLGAVFLFGRFSSEIFVLGFARLIFPANFSSVARVSSVSVSILLSAAEHRQRVFFSSDMFVLSSLVLCSLVASVARGQRFGLLRRFHSA